MRGEQRRDLGVYLVNPLLDPYLLLLPAESELLALRLVPELHFPAQERQAAVGLCQHVACCLAQDAEHQPSPIGG